MALSDEELEILAEKLLAKLLERLARREREGATQKPPPRKPPSPEVIEEVLARRRRRAGRMKR